ncbi:hypothetical protein DRN38_07630 [Thermococci archaeon]|nr:MAG: hypothetical protein DRN38_07630 [Thermococci archaeon]RLF83048.1 MAG: hypothetical protein DRN41_08180 [Thermococci archaeon]
MNRRRAIFIVLLLLVFYFLPKGVIIETDEPTDVSFGETLPKHCPFTIKTKSLFFESGLNNVTFHLLKNNTVLANYTLKGIEGSYLCLPDGILLCAYYPSDPAGDTSMVFLNYNLSEKWRKKFDGLVLPKNHENSSLLLVKRGNFELSVKSCIYKINTATGNLTYKFCPDIPRGSWISDVEILGDKYYFVVTWVDAGMLWVRTNGELYLVKGYEGRKARVASIDSSALGAGFWVDANDKYVAVAYFLANEVGDWKNGLCVFTSDHLIKIACKKFDKTPKNVRIEGRTIYVKFRDGTVKAYKIIAP